LYIIDTYLRFSDYYFEVWDIKAYYEERDYHIGKGREVVVKSRQQISDKCLLSTLESNILALTLTIGTGGIL
jgi:hypothetical protein